MLLHFGRQSSRQIRGLLIFAVAMILVNLISGRRSV
jgi:hypothetical protein